MLQFCKTIIVLIICLVLFSCNSKKRDYIETVQVDFANRIDSTSFKFSTDSVPVLKVAVSAIISPKETYRFYSELLEYISKKINYQIVFKQRKTYEEVNDMLGTGEVDMAFICSGAYIDAKKTKGVEILAQPVCNGKTVYQAYIITHKSSGIEDFVGLKGKTFAFTDPLSNSGKLYAVKRTKDLDTSPDEFFSSTLYTYAHDKSIHLVAKQLIDGATIDGLIYNYMLATTPDLVKNVRIIEKSEDFGIPPIVVPGRLNAKLKKQLKEIVLAIHDDSLGKEILDRLLIERFVEGSDRDYDGIRKIIYEVEN